MCYVPVDDHFESVEYLVQPGEQMSDCSNLDLSSFSDREYMKEQIQGRPRVIFLEASPDHISFPSTTMHTAWVAYYARQQIKNDKGFVLIIDS